MLYLFFFFSHHSQLFLKGYSHLRQSWHIDTICHKCLIGVGPTFGSSTCFKYGGPLTPHPHLCWYYTEWRGGHAFAAISVHFNESSQYSRVKAPIHWGNITAECPTWRHSAAISRAPFLPAIDKRAPTNRQLGSQCSTRFLAADSRSLLPG